MNTTLKNIEQMILQVGLGDRVAFRSLYQATSPKLFGICIRILKDRSEAEDALQEVYIKVWRAASKFASLDSSPISWLAAIARNHAIDIVRARRPDVVDIDATEELTDDDLDPEQRAIGMSEGRRIERCLDELEAARADAIRGAYIEGFSYQELSDRYDVPINTMRTWLRRGLAKLRECLER